MTCFLLRARNSLAWKQRATDNPAPPDESHVTPTFLPTAVTLGIDPLHFGIFMVANLCIRLVTPPVGTVLFAGCGIANVSISDIVRPLIPPYIAMLIALILIVYVPEIT